MPSLVETGVFLKDIYQYIPGHELECDKLTEELFFAASSNSKNKSVKEQEVASPLNMGLVYEFDLRIFHKWFVDLRFEKVLFPGEKTNLLQ